MTETLLVDLNASLARASAAQNYLFPVLTHAPQTNPGSSLVDLLNQTSEELDNLVERLQAAIQSVLDAYQNEGELQTLEDWERALNLFGISLTVGAGLDQATEWGRDNGNGERARQAYLGIRKIIGAIARELANKDETTVDDEYLLKAIALFVDAFGA